MTYIHIHIHINILKVISNKYKETESVYGVARKDLISEAKKALFAHRGERMESMERERVWGLREVNRAEVGARLEGLRAQKVGVSQ
jgi:hypothetical protein